MSDTRLIDPNDILAWMRESFNVDAERGVITWRDGFTDKRRLHNANGGRTPPKEGCRRWRKYAA
jgi:hypothetical protein